MAKVIYKRGSKATYLGLLERSPDALYFCTDTRELFRGDELYTDGLRMVNSYDKLPSFVMAAEGKLYYCEDTGCGYVLSESRDGWICVIHGVDNETIGINEDGFMAIKTVQIGSVFGLENRLKAVEDAVLNIEMPKIASSDVPGLVKASQEIGVDTDGALGVIAVEQKKVVGLEDRLTVIEKSIAGGVRYRGAVDTFDDLPADAVQGDLYEVRADNSEWCFNGEKWFEYGKVIDLSGYATKNEVRRVAKQVEYEVSHKPIGTLVNYREDEIRVMCPADTKWIKQDVGAAGNENMYYMGFKAYAPDDAVSFKEGDHGVIIDEMFTFDGDFAGTDEFGRNYSICWLALASYDEASGTWTYFGKNSTAEKYFGWDYVVEWYDKDGVMIVSDGIRINLSNEDCHSDNTPYYVSKLQAALNTVEAQYSWSDM